MKILVVVCLIALVCLVVDYGIYYVKTQRCLKENKELIDLKDSLLDAHKKLTNKVIEENDTLKKENEQLKSILNS